MAQLNHWFSDKVITDMRGEDFGVAIYEVPHEFVLRGAFQVLFNITKAKRVSFT